MSETDHAIIVVAHLNDVPNSDPYTLYDTQSGSKGWRNFMLKRHKKCSDTVDPHKTVWHLGWNGQRLARNRDAENLLKVWDPDGDLYAWVVSSLLMDDLGIPLFRFPPEHQESAGQKGVFDRHSINV